MDKAILNYIGNVVGGMTFGIGCVELYNSQSVWEQGHTISYDFAYLMVAGAICLMVTEIMKRS